MSSAYFQVCGLDPVRDEALMYEKVLREQYGSNTKVDVFAGLPHAPRQVYPAFKKGKRAIEDMVNWFKWLLQQRMKKKSSDY